MMVKLPIDRLVELAPKVPYEILYDVKERMGDWVLGGGNQDDPYMWQQIRFIENWIDKFGDESN